MLPTMAEIEAARRQVALHAWRTPLVRLDPMRSRAFAGDADVVPEAGEPSAHRRLQDTRAAAVVGALAPGEQRGGWSRPPPGTWRRRWPIWPASWAFPARCWYRSSHRRPRSSPMSVWVRASYVSHEWWEAFQKRCSRAWKEPSCTPSTIHR